jgi:hypothetical protein
MRWSDAPWDAWHPSEAAWRLAGVSAPWYVAAGWSIDLFLRTNLRDHEDLEIAVPAERFGEIEAALPGLAFHVVVAQGEISPIDEVRDRLADTHQTWGLDLEANAWRIDVFREPSRDGRWVARRDERISLPYDELVERTADGVPYARPEVTLLFKAKAAREKDEADLEACLPRLEPSRRRLLAGWLELVHPRHPWIERLS